MRRLIERTLRRRPAALSAAAGSGDADAFPPPRPDRPFYAVGDIHGCADLVLPLLDRIERHAAERGVDDPNLLFLGDYIDRGPASAEVLGILHGLSAHSPGRVVCLMGNHERMMLDFLDDPAAGPLWLRNGGVATLASYGIAPPSGLRPDAGALGDLAATLRESLPDGLEDWLRALPLSWRSGTVCAAHAGADPARDLDDQTEAALLWGHRDFRRRARTDGVWVVHGHTIVDAPTADSGRIAVDTGAVFTGRLTAAALSPDGRIGFLTGAASTPA